MKGWTLKTWHRRESCELAIFDDIFPYAVSGFRLEEYTQLLHRFPGSGVFSTLASLEWLGVGHLRPQVLAAWSHYRPDLAERLVVVNAAHDMPDSNGYYTVFLNNALQLLNIAEERSKLFSFTLYPGGGMRLGDAIVDERLRRIASSPSLFKVIVTQPAVLAYLAQNHIFDIGQIEYVFGGAVPPNPHPPRDWRSLKESDTLRVAFVANKYHPLGLDKGLDIFVGAFQSVGDLGVPVDWHFVGPWSACDIAETLGMEPDPVGSIEFHGLVNSWELPSLLSEIDICVFPTRSGCLGEGSFDGFPVGAAVEAGLAGCVVITTNPLAQESPLLPNRHYLEIGPSSKQVADHILQLNVDRPRLHQLGTAAQHGFSAIYSRGSQMSPRERVLREMIEASTRMPSSF